MSSKRNDFPGNPPSIAVSDPFTFHNDPLLPGFWHLSGNTGAIKGVNVTDVWDEFRGAGIIVGVIDDGVEYTHPDLAANYNPGLDFDTRDNDFDAYPSDPTDRHGTTVAGVVASPIDNGIGGAGVAPGATIVGYRIGFGANGTVGQIEAAFARLTSVDVANNSWGFDGFLGDDFNSPSFAATGTALENALDTGRGGRGTIVVFAAGNSRADGEDVNYHNFQNHRGIIAVAATDSSGNVASFSTPGDAILVAAPGVGIQTTDRVGSAGFVAGDYASVSGTSFSTPIVSGVAALMLDANPDLGWRDVQEILASTAIQTGNPAGWSFNHAFNWNGGAMHVSHDLGYGLVDAMAAVRVAESWHQVSTSANETFVTNSVVLNAPIPDLGTVQSVLNLAAGVRIDHVEVDLNLLHSYIGDLRVTLTSPTGTQSVLFNTPPTSQDNIFFTFSTTHDWGELSAGAWTLSVSDLFAQDTGTLLSWAIRAYGDPVGNDTYVYTDEFSVLAAADATRRTLTDTGGVDGINAAAIASATSLDLRPGQTSIIDGQNVTIASGTVIENADTGDGNDTIIGNDVANWLRGWRGNDTLDGGAGADTLDGGAGNDTYVVDSVVDVVVESINAGTDLVKSSVSYTLAAYVENLTLTGNANVNGTGNGDDNVLTGTDQRLPGTGNNTLTGGAGNDLLDGRTGFDTLIGGTGDDTYIINNYSGGQTSLLLQSEAGDYVGAGQTYSFIAGTGTFTPTLFDQNNDGQIDFVRFGYVDFSNLRFSLDFSTTKLGTNFLPGTYLNAERASFASPGHPGLDVSGDGRGSNQVYGSFTVTAADFDYSGSSPVLLDLSVSFEQHSEFPWAPALYGTLNYNYAPAGPAVFDAIVENSGEGIDTVRAAFSYTLGGNVENLVLTGSGNINGTGNVLANAITGNGGGNTLDGGAGADTLSGGAGDDTYVVDDVADVIVEGVNAGTDLVKSAVSYTLSANVENLTLTGNANVNGTGNELNNILSGNSGVNLLAGGAGSDTYVVDNVADVVVEGVDAGTDLVKSSVSHTLSANVENLTLTGGTNINGTGNGGDNVLIGTDQRLPGTGNNTLTGGAGNDLLDGKTGFDTLIGGTGDDTYIIDNYSGGQTSLLLQSETGDYIGGGQTYQIDTGTGTFTPYLYDKNQDGQIDYVHFFYAGFPDHWFYLDFSTTQLGTNFQPGTYLNAERAFFATPGHPGLDVSGDGHGLSQVYGSFTVIAADFDYSGSSPVLLDLSVSFEQHGDSPSAPALYGTLNYNYAPAGPAIFDAIVENSGEGIDTVRAAISYTLGGNVENLVLTGSGNINGTGNVLANAITGNGGNNTIDGGAGADMLSGAGGNDIYLVDNVADVVVESTNAGTDLVKSAVSYTLSANVENLTLTGNANVNGTGNELDNILSGNSGANLLAGGAGNDTYVIDDVADVVVEGVDAGTDLVKSSVSHTLSANVENLTLTGGANINGTGNGGDNILTGTDQRLPGTGSNTLTGGAGNDVLDGKTGFDTLIGGTGDDTYIIDNYSGGQTSLLLQSESGDYIGRGQTYLFDTGTGTFTPYLQDRNFDGQIDYLYFIYAGLSDHWFTLHFSTTQLGTNILPGTYLNAERAVFATPGHPGLEIYGDGTSSNQIYGSFTVIAADFDYSGSSPVLLDLSVSFEQHSESPTAPALFGTLNYNYAPAGPAVLDAIVENSGEGIDTVRAAISYTLGANVENLVLTGSGNINGTGNALDNVLTGNSAANVLAGKAGNDTYVVDNAGDVVTENANEGTDLVQSSVSYTLSANVENLTLTGVGAINGTGNVLNNQITGNSGNNILDGGAGADALSGGAGNDTYIVDNALDVITENLNEGTDGVQSSVTYTLSANVEDLTLTGAGAINGSGNTLNNVLTGNSANNTLDGKAGADTMTGGAGDDLYIVDNAGDVVVENFNEGTDTVQSSITYTLGAEVEHLTLTGTAAINGTGNALVNYLTGNSANNTLIGGAGNDVLNGDLGSDTMIGGTGNDAYRVDNVGDVVIELPGEGDYDLVYSFITYTLVGTELEQLGLLGTGVINATGNARNNNIYGNNSDNILDGGAGIDTMSGALGNDTYIVDSTADIVTEGANGGIDTVQSSATYTLSANVENLILTGAAIINGTGNVLDNAITGNSANNSLSGGVGNDVLDGGAGADTLDGGIGDDILIGGAGNDLYVLNAGFGRDLIIDTDATAGNVDTISFGAGITSGAVTVSRVGNDLKLAVGADAVTVQGWYASDDNKTELVRFADGTIWTVATLLGTSNHAPTLANALADQNAAEDALFSYVVPGNAFADVDVGDTLTYGATKADGGALPSWLTFNAVSRTFSGTPLNADVGTLSIKVIATDSGGLSVLDIFDVVVANTNDAPTLANALADQAAIQDTVFSFTVPGNAFADVDAGDVLTYSASRADGSALPAWVTFNALTRTFSGTPLNGDVGTVGFRVTATDTGGLSVYDIFDVVISPVSGQTLIGTTGNDVLTGGAGNDTIDGRAGADTMIGKAGNDTYIVDNALDVVTENLNEGTDGVQSSVTYTLSANVENLTLTGAGAINGSGNALNNVLTGNSANNTLDGKAGADTMTGGAGDDTYIVDNAGDLVVENFNEGTDGVQSSITYTLGADVENLYLTGAAAINGTGNALGNYMVGNSANNTLIGGAGNDVLNGDLGTDTMIGGTGNDAYRVDNVGDVVIELPGEGDYDLVYSFITYTLVGTELEQLGLLGTGVINATGNARNNNIYGNNSDNILDGGAGIDTMSGALGNDTYIVDSAADIVKEDANGGIDAVQSSATFTLSANVENLILTGAASINGTGNVLDNLLVGNTSNNALTGGAGNDLLNGGTGTGADTLTGDAGADVLEGMDGSDTLSDTSGNNLFNGGAGSDALTGNSGNELFIGGAGNDTVTTGSGADIIAFNRGDGQDVINASTGADNTLSIGGSIRYTDMSFSRNGNDLVLNLGGAAEQVTLAGWYAAQANHSVLNMQVIARAMADFDANSADALRNRNVVNFDFQGLVTAFDNAGQAANWALTNTLLNAHLSGSSNSAALGGDLAYRYGLTGSLANIGFDPAVTILSDGSFGASAQVLQSQAALEQGVKRLS